MRGRPVLLTLSALFLAVAGGQALSAISAGYEAAEKAKSPKQVMARQTEMSAHQATQSDDGIDIVDDRSGDAPIEDWETKLESERYALSKERKRLEAEELRIHQAKEALETDQTAQHRRLATVYAEMPAAKAAAVIGKLKPEEAASFIALMPEEASAEILSALPSDAAVAISREILTRTSTANRRG